MSDPMIEIRASFFVECDELLEPLQDGLQAIDDGEADDETINIVFRAVHSIKGGAGAFGLDDLVHFAHHFETALDEVRAGRFVPDAVAMKLFFQCADHLADVINCSRDQIPVDTATSARLLEELSSIVNLEEPEEEVIDFQPMTLALDLDLGMGTDGPGDMPLPDLSLDAPKAGYDIHFKPHAQLYQSGNEPLFLLRTLGDLGHVTTHADISAIPELGDFDPADSYISWTISIETPDEDTAIHDVFEFVDGICDLTITPHGAEPEAAPLMELPPIPSPIAQPEIAAPEPMVAEDNVPPKSTEPTQAAKTATPSPKVQQQPRATVRVDLDRIDRLVNLVGELVINQAMLSQSVAKAGLTANATVQTGLEEFMQLTRDVQESVMMIRAQPIKSLFQRMGRIVRESSADIGKEVRLRTEGEATEVDKTVVERLADPLTHMIRNAVDHGLEKTEDRIKAGKTAEGIVTLTASHRSGRVVIEVSDDGAGINRERVQQIATDKGLIQPDAQLSETEIDNLLFLPGFSTASEVSNLSGRGVGMDVVRSAISALGGRITTSSTPGQGTKFSISLPLTLAVLDGMVVRVANETIVVPLSAILETLTIGEDDVRDVGAGSKVVQIRGGFVPLLDLGSELGYRDPLKSYLGEIVLLITQENGDRVAVLVDAIEDQRQVVIKGLEDTYGHVPGIAAATILGDGQIALILDPVDLFALPNKKTRKSPMPLAG